MENQTRNTILVICALLTTFTICFVAISNELDKRAAIKLISESFSEFDNQTKKWNQKSLARLLKTKSQTINQKNIEISRLKNQNLSLKKELNIIKRRFATQIEAEKQKANIKWSDGSNEPKYNQIQEGINWSKSNE